MAQGVKSSNHGRLVVTRAVGVEGDHWETCIAQKIVWIQLIVKISSSTVSWGGPISRAITRELVHGCRSTAAVVAFSLAGVRTVRGRGAFICAIGVKTARVETSGCRGPQ